MRGLDGRTYIVTGAASGIGRATAERLLSEGARVVGADLVDPAGTVLEEPDRWLSTWRTRARSKCSAAAAVAFGGTVDGLVNAAGVAGAAAPWTCCRPGSGPG